MSMHGIDYGRWTEWKRPENPPKPIDFVIAGLTSGDYWTTLGRKNVEAVKAEKRRITYHFYEFKTNWVPQVEVALEAAEAVNAHAIAWDYETQGYPWQTNYPGSKGNIERVANETREALKRLGAHYPVLLYSNFNNYINHLKPYIGHVLNDIELWIAYPHAGGYPPRPGVLPASLWGKTGRPEDDWKFHQYSWHGDAPAYGAVNEKKEMDLNVFNGTEQELDAFLGISEQPPAEWTTQWEIENVRLQTR